MEQLETTASPFTSTLIDSNVSETAQTDIICARYSLHTNYDYPDRNLCHLFVREIDRVFSSLLAKNSNNSNIFFSVSFVAFDSYGKEVLNLSVYELEKVSVELADSEIFLTYFVNDLVDIDLIITLSFQKLLL